MNSFALLVSTFFEPMIVVYVLALLAGVRTGVSNWYFGYSTLLVIFVTIFRLYITSHDRTNWDITERKKRIKPLFLLIIFLMLQFFMVRIFGNAAITSLFWMFVYWIIGFFLLTFTIKLSGHLSVLTLAVLQIIYWYGVWASPALLGIPLLSWSRIRLKRHTLFEVLAGIIYSSGIFLWLH